MLYISRFKNQRLLNTLKYKYIFVKSSKTLSEKIKKKKN